MNQQELIREISEIHNTIIAISVRGDDAILISQAIIKLRNLVQRLNSEQTEVEHNQE